MSEATLPYPLADFEIPMFMDAARRIIAEAFEPLERKYCHTWRGDRPVRYQFYTTQNTVTSGVREI